MVASTFIFNADNRDAIVSRLGRFLAAWPKDKPCIVTVARYVRSRSNAQNAALWGLAYKVLGEATGFRATELHEYFCGEYFGWHEHAIFGMRKRRPRRTTTTNEDGQRDVISTEECAKFFDFIQQRAAELEINIPDPEPAWFARKARAQ